METVGSNMETAASGSRRKRRNNDDAKLRFFMPKEGSTSKALQLGDEVPSEGEALIRSLKSDQPFLVVTAWKAVAEQNGKGPVIVKQPAPDKLD